jgi:SAM-dependent methyltransferase
MEFFDLVNISERYLDFASPVSPAKVVELGKYLGLREGSRAIDFACGYAESLVLWAEHFGIAGTGVEVREHACRRARARVAEKGLSGRIEIVCAQAADYPITEHAFDAATCIGASFAFGGYRHTIRALKRAVRATGRLAIGEPYWLRDRVPPELVAQEPGYHSEFDLLRIAREEGFDFEYVIRASQDDWDRYEAGNWHGLIRWLEDHPDHPEREVVIQHLRKIQDNYLGYGREYVGWAMYVLAPQSYRS